ncbi:MAG: class I SAM-dependent methyltransferase, partial [Candidatus Limnocylindrales bacterium]
EHLVDPWSVLVAQRSLLRPGGQAIFSLPNVRNIRILASLLLRGEWRYTDEGILSIGHLRFFTTRGMRRLINGAGYEILREEANYAPRGVWLRRLSLGILDDLAAEQRLFVARVV